MKILVISDEKKGHENQSLGLAEALLRRRPGSYELVSCNKPIKLDNNSHFDLAISAGTRTHPFLLRWSRALRCSSVVIMKPSLFPSFLFSFCLIPQHDFKPDASETHRRRLTKGSLNRIPEEHPPKEACGLILIGGPSKHYRWEETPIIEAIKRIISARPDLTWTLGDSRRTPESTRRALLQLELPISFVSHQAASSDWLPQELLRSSEAWVSPDSASMLSEALTAGCRLGTLPLPGLDTRVSRAHDRFATEGYLTPFAKWEQLSPHEPLALPPQPLHETARCATWLLEQLDS